MSKSDEETMLETYKARQAEAAAAEQRQQQAIKNVSELAKKQHEEAVRAAEGQKHYFP